MLRCWSSTGSCEESREGTSSGDELEEGTEPPITLDHLAASPSSRDPPILNEDTEGEDPVAIASKPPPPRAAEPCAAQTQTQNKRSEQYAAVYPRTNSSSSYLREDGMGLYQCIGRSHLVRSFCHPHCPSECGRMLTQCCSRPSQLARLCPHLGASQNLLQLRRFRCHTPSTHNSRAALCVP